MWMWFLCKIICQSSLQWVWLVGLAWIHLLPHPSQNICESLIAYLIWSPGWDKVNWLPKSGEGGMAPLAAPSDPTSLHIRTLFCSLPADRWTYPNLSTILWHWVPLPAPGAPKTNTTLGLAILIMQRAWVWVLITPNKRLLQRLHVNVACSNELVGVSSM